MDLESQNIEYKQSWHDEYLKWVCGFANAQGGRIYIGKDDNGVTVGVEDAKRLSEDIPNKIRNYLGITCEVNLLEDNGLPYVEIVVKPYGVAISYKGSYYYRSGSVKSELTGAALNDFLLKKSGLTWDEVIEERASMADIDHDSIVRYLQFASMGDRLPNVVGLDDYQILEKLRLVEGGKITLWNLGQLPDSLTAEELTQFHASYPRNPLIAGACFKATLIDSWGSGISKIMTACKNEGLPEPRFEAFGGGVLVTLFKPKMVGDEDSTSQKTGTKTSQKTGTKTSQKTNTKTSQKTGTKTSQIAMEILRYLRKNPKASRKELSVYFGRTSSSIQWHIEQLKKKGLIRHVGSDKGGYWEIILV